MECRRSADHRRSIDCPPRPPLPGSSTAARSAVHSGPRTAWSSATQIALAGPRGSTDTASPQFTLDQQRANAASSSFFSPAVAKTVPSLSLVPTSQEPDSKRAAEIANAAASSFFAPAVLRQPQQQQQQQQQHAYGSVSQTAHLHRPSPPMHGNPPTPVPQYTRATRGSFDQPQARARGSFDQAQARASFDQPVARGSFDQLQVRGAFEQPQARARASFDQPQIRTRNSFDQAQGRARSSFEQTLARSRNSFGEAQPAASRSSIEQVQATARNNLEQFQARAMTNQSMLGSIPEQAYTQGIPPSPSHGIQNLTPFGQVAQNPGQQNMALRYPVGQFANMPPNPGGYPHSLARMSCDYPQAVANPRVAANPRTQGQLPSSLDRASSSGAAVSRQSLVASQEFARLDEATKRHAALAALGAGSFPPNQLWSQQSANFGSPSPSGSPFGKWPAQPAVDLQSYQPHALQLHALNTLQALNRSAQHPQGRSSFWEQPSQQPQSQAVHNEFPAVDAFPATGFPSTPSSNVSYSSSPPAPFPKRSPNDSQSSHHSLQKPDVSPSRQVLTEVGVNASELQGAWGAHIDSGANTPTPRKSGSARGQSYNPFLQPQSTFSIREAKMQLQNPTPRGPGNKLHFLSMDLSRLRASHPS